MKKIDLNSDLGEGASHDAGILTLITSANIACGYHAGDEDTMRRTIRMALNAGVKVGAHPGYDDRANFGRKPVLLSEEELFDLVHAQVHTLYKMTRELGGELHHVKPHGAMYNAASVDYPVALVIARAVREVDPQLVLFGLSGSQLIRAGREMGLKTASEVFADRTYTDEGLLVPRSQPGAVITDVEQSLAQVKRMVEKGEVVSISGTIIPIEADTLCVHGDEPQALSFVFKIKELIGI